MVTSQMDMLDPPISISSEDNISKLKYIQENIFTLPEHQTNFPKVQYMNELCYTTMIMYGQSVYM